MSIDELEVALMQLAPEERERLGHKLLGSVPVCFDFEAEWSEEIDRRIREVAEGEVSAMSSESMFKDALRRLA